MHSKQRKVRGSTTKSEDKLVHQKKGTAAVITDDCAEAIVRKWFLRPLKYSMTGTKHTPLPLNIRKCFLEVMRVLRGR